MEDDDDYQDPRPIHCGRPMWILADWNDSGRTTRAWYKCAVCKAQIEEQGQQVFRFE